MTTPEEGRHRIPTQVGHPWRATLRTFVQYLPAVALLVLAVPEVVEVILEEAGGHLPESFRAVLLGIATGAAVLAAVVARVMALASVTRFLERSRLLGWLAPAPAPPVTPPGEVVDAVRDGDVRGVG